MKINFTNYKVVTINWLLVLLIIFSFVSCTKKEKLSEKIVIKVNNESMTAGDFSQRLAKNLKAYDSLLAKDEKTINQTKADIIEEFIVQVITSDWAKSNNIFVRKKLLDEKIKFYRSLYPDDLSFRRSLAEEGLSFSDWKEKLKQSLLQELVSLELFKNSANPTTKEKKAYYESHKSEYKRPDEVRLRQIVVKTQNDALHIEKQIRKGKSIRSLARKFSISPEGQNGGDLGWIQRGTFDIFDHAFNMRKGQKSRVLKSPFGYHIIKVVDKRKAKQLSYNDVKASIEKRLLAEKEQIVFSNWLEKEIRKTKVLKNEKMLEKITVHTRGKG